MTLRLHNTLSRKVEDFAPIDAENVRMYVCGPTVYDRAHLGNARPVVVFDTLFRLLRHVYGADHVTYVRNFTDVDDKINAKAAETGRRIGAITEETIGWYHADMDALGALRPTHEPRATAFIPQMVAMISELIEKKFAYEVRATIGHNSGARYVFLDNNHAPSHSFLSVDSFNDRVEQYRYGRLSGRSLEDMIVGSRAEVGEGKRNPMDSVLWKPSTFDQPGWESPWGFGRPGWHIECSAMSRNLLGKQFDIHGGGLDLLFPHHENELAQCTACDGAGSSAQYWLHNEMLQVEGKKMSKSLGNFFTVRDLLDQGIPGEVIRFVLLSTHYRKPMDWTKEKALEAKSTLSQWFTLTDGDDSQQTVPDWMLDHLANDLNTPGFISAIHQMASVGKVGIVKSAMKLIGLPEAESVDWFRNRPVIVSLSGESSTHFPEVRSMLLVWQELRDAKKYIEADELRANLERLGLKLSITAGGPQADVPNNFEPSKLEALK